EYDRSDGSRPDTDHEVGQARIGIALPARGGQLHADAAFAFRNFGAAEFYASFPSYEETRTLTAALGWTALDAAAPASPVIEPSLSVRRHADEFILRRDDPAFYHNVHTSWQYGGELQARYAPSARVHIAAGGELFGDRLESNALGERAATRAAAFGELAAGAPGDWLVQTGLRLDWHSEFGEFLAPSIALAFWPADPLRVRGSVGRSFRAPGWTERFYEDPANIGSPDLEPERAWTAEIGAELALPAGRIDIATFIRQAENLIDWARSVLDDPAAPWRTMNVEDATFRGVEATLSLRGPLETQWSVAATALSLDASERHDFTSKYVLRPLAHTAQLAVERSLNDGFGIGARVRNARRMGEDPFTVADLRFSYGRGSIRAFADLTNVTGEQHLDVSAQPAPGRQFHIGLRWTGS
ncbi:MAG: TonB-dependent receptor plug domain-containing protein, partial [Longimicrobiales bacterium]